MFESVHDRRLSLFQVDGLRDAKGARGRHELTRADEKVPKLLARTNRVDDPDEFTAIGNFDGLTTLDGGEVAARVLAKFANPNALHGARVAHKVLQMTAFVVLGGVGLEVSGVGDERY